MDGTRPHQVQDQDQASFFVETKTVSSPPESRVLSSVCSVFSNAYLECENNIKRSRAPLTI